MKNNDFNLILLHHEEVFETRELAFEYLEGFYKPNSLDAEPVIVKYGDERKPNVILAFGTSNVAPGGFFAIDITKANEQIEELYESVDGDKEELDYVSEILEGVVKSCGLTLDENKITDKVSYDPDPRDNVIGEAETIAEAISLLSEYAQNAIIDNEIFVEDTNSIALMYEVNPNGGKSLKAQIKLSNNGDSDNLTYNNNIIGVKNDGIYAASHLGYDDVRHELTFTTSGYKDGRFQDDAIVEKIDIGQHTKVLSDNEGKSVKVDIAEDVQNNTFTLSANARLGSNNSIVFRNGGLEANVSIDVNTATNKLILTVGDNTITKDLPGVELIDNIEYDSANNDIVIVYNENKRVTIPLRNLIAEFNFQNDANHDVELTTSANADGSTDVYAKTKVSDDIDNLLTHKNGALFVSESNIDDKVTVETTRATQSEIELQNAIDDLVASTTEGLDTLNESLNNVAQSLGEEIDEKIQTVTYTAGDGLSLENNEFSVKLNENTEHYLQLTEGGLKIIGINDALLHKANSTDVDELSDKIDVINGNESTEGSIKNALKTAKDYTDEKVADLSDNTYTKDESDAKYLTEHQDISNLATKQEVSDVDDKATQNAADIASLSSAIDDINFETQSTNTVILTNEKQIGAEKRTIKADVRIKNSNVNIIKSDSEGISANVSLTYDSVTNTLNFNDGNGNKEIKLTGVSLVERAEYDSESKTIKLYVKTGDVPSVLSIYVGDLVDTWTVDDGLNNPIHLNFQNDVLTATLRISDEGKNLISQNPSGLYASSDATNHFAEFGGQETTVQRAINMLRDEDMELGTKIDDLEDELARLTRYEFKDGLQKNANNEVSLKLDDSSEDFVSVGEDGLKVSGIQDAIDGAVQDVTGAITTQIENTVAELDAEVKDALDENDDTQVEEGKHVGVKIVEEDGVLIEVSIVENDIASASAVAEIDEELALKANADNVYTKQEVDDALSEKTDLNRTAEIERVTSEALNNLNGKIAENEEELALKANANDVYTKQQNKRLILHWKMLIQQFLKRLMLMMYIQNKRLMMLCLKRLTLIGLLKLSVLPLKP